MAEVFRNFAIIVRGHRPNYLFSFILRGMIAILHAVLFDVQDLREYMPILLFQCCSFLLIFNPMLNAARGRDFWYVGRNSGWLDSMFYHDRTFYILVYFGCLSVCVTSLFVIYFRYG